MGGMSRIDNEDWVGGVAVAYAGVFACLLGVLGWDVGLIPWLFVYYSFADCLNGAGLERSCLLYYCCASSDCLRRLASFATAVHGQCTELEYACLGSSDLPCRRTCDASKKVPTHMLLCFSHGSEPARSVWSRPWAMLSWSPSNI